MFHRNTTVRSSSNRPVATILALVLGTAFAATGCDRDRDWQAGFRRDNCPPEECGVNGVQLADMMFGHLSLDGVPNRRSMAIVDVVAPSGASLMLDVVAGRFVAVDPESGAAVLTGRELEGSAIIVARSTEEGVSEWRIVIESMDSVSFMSNERGSIPSYRLSYEHMVSGTAVAPLCRGGASAVIIAGDESFHPTTLELQPGATERGFTLACENHLLGKAMRMSYDAQRAVADPYYTTAQQRQATLRMLRADYCGTGRPFTLPGTSVYWQNRAGWMVEGAPESRPVAVEAGWDEYGATCLNTPRRLDRYSRTEIESACGGVLPHCMDEILATSEWVTWLP